MRATRGAPKKRISSLVLCDRACASQLTLALVLKRRLAARAGCIFGEWVRDLCDTMWTSEVSSKSPDIEFAEIQNFAAAIADIASVTRLLLY